jgi:CobQ-like glutamine amidotransferase family enzyme
MKLHLVHLYPAEMNIYGDTGNRLVIQKRLEWRGIEVKTSLIGIGDEVPLDSDIIIGGGGQDAVQSEVQQDLQIKAASLQKLADNMVVMLMVCGWRPFKKTPRRQNVCGLDIVRNCSSNFWMTTNTIHTPILSMLRPPLRTYFWSILVPVKSR